MSEMPSPDRAVLLLLKKNSPFWLFVPLGIELTLI